MLLNKLPRLTVALKFLLLFASLGTFLVALHLGVIVYMTQHQPAFRRTLNQVFEFVADAILKHPSIASDPKVLAGFAQQLGVDLQIRMGDRDLTTLPTPYTLEPMLKRAVSLTGNGTLIVQDTNTGRWLLTVNRPSGRLTVVTPPGHWVETRRLTATALISTSILSFLLSFLVARRLLNPLKPLIAATVRFKEGDLKHRIDCRNRDEFGDLSRSFNDMAENLSAMIHNKEQLLLDVSHELRTPLTRMRIALELMPDVPRRSDLLDDVREMDVMVNDLLEAHRLQNPYGSLHKERIDLNTLLYQITARFEDRKPGVKLEQNLVHAHVQADPNRIVSLVRNVIENAVKYSGEQSTPVDVALSVADGNAVITVRDHGPGIPEEDLERVFEPFYRVDKSRTRATGGFGLGLPLCRNIAAAHGGDLTLANAPGGGLMAIVRLPLEASATTRS